MKKIFLIYTGSTGFPLGDAYTNRVLSIAKGLVSLNCDLKLLIIYPGKASGVNTRLGVFDSVPFEYLTTRKSNPNVVLKKIIGIMGILNACLKIIFSKHLDSIISFSAANIQNIPISICSKIKNILFIREVNEYPKEVLRSNSEILNEKINKKIQNSLNWFDGLICISHGLKNHFNFQYSFIKPILIVPITVDKSRFKNCINMAPKNFITYCGNLFGEKDGVEILVKAFKKISENHIQYSLKLVGNTENKSEFKKLNKLIEELELSDKVIFTGHLERDIIPSILCESSILTLARPNNIQAKGGFPTKLGEYLATGRPVVVTAVGDIPKYIIDGVNGYLANPGSVDSFAQKLDSVLSNYKEASIVGLEGQKLVQNTFDANIQARRILDYIESLEVRK